MRPRKRINSHELLLLLLVNVLRRHFGVHVQFLGTMRRSPGSAADNACGLSVVECIIVSVLRRRASIKPAPAGVCVCESGCRCWWPSRSTESTPLGGSGSSLQPPRRQLTVVIQPNSSPAAIARHFRELYTYRCRRHGNVEQVRSPHTRPPRSSRCVSPFTAIGRSNHNTSSGKQFREDRIL